MNSGIIAIANSSNMLYGFMITNSPILFLFLLDGSSVLVQGLKVFSVLLLWLHLYYVFCSKSLSQ